MSKNNAPMMKGQIVAGKRVSTWMSQVFVTRTCELQILSAFACSLLVQGLHLMVSNMEKQASLTKEASPTSL
jgi:hypothetical protein